MYCVSLTLIRTDHMKIKCLCMHLQYIAGVTHCTITHLQIKCTMASVIRWAQGELDGSKLSSVVWFGSIRFCSCFSANTTLAWCLATVGELISRVPTIFHGSEAKLADGVFFIKLTINPFKLEAKMLPNAGFVLWRRYFFDMCFESVRFSCCACLYYWNGAAPQSKAALRRHLLAWRRGSGAIHNASDALIFLKKIK